MRDEPIQRSNLAGTWYPGDPRELRALLERMLGEGRQEQPELRALIAPHAGYRYSGPTAASAFSKIPRGRWRRALVLAPSHYVAFAGAAVFPGEGFETPLGVVAVDSELARELGRQPLFEATARPYAREHALEIQLPFLQVVDPAIAIVPLLFGVADDEATLEALADGLRAVVDDETLVIVSSDFTHYGAQFDYLPFPAADAAEVAAEIHRLDAGAIEPICRGDADRFARYVRATGITICGRGPIAAFLRFENGELAGELVRYATSLDVTGDHEHSVSYAAITFRPGHEVSA